MRDGSWLILTHARMSILALRDQEKEAWSQLGKEAK